MCKSRFWFCACSDSVTVQWYVYCVPYCICILFPYCQYYLAWNFSCFRFLSMKRIFLDGFEKVLNTCLDFCLNSEWSAYMYCKIFKSSIFSLIILLSSKLFSEWLNSSRYRISFLKHSIVSTFYNIKYKNLNKIIIIKIHSILPSLFWTLFALCDVEPFTFLILSGRIVERFRFIFWLFYFFIFLNQIPILFYHYDDSITNRKIIQIS